MTRENKYDNGLAMKRVMLIASLLCFATACENKPAPAANAPASATTSATTSAASATGHAHGHAGHGKAKKAKRNGKSQVYFLVPLDGAEVFEQVRVAIDTQNVRVEKAFIVIDGKAIKAGTAIKTSDSVVALKSKMAGNLKLSPGEHRLTVQLADADGNSLGEAMSSNSKVRVIPQPQKLGVAFAEPKDGAKVKSPLALKFEVMGMPIVKAGEKPTHRTSGHHHVVIDGKPIAVGKAVPANKTHIHYGKGQTEATLELSKGKHTLTMQFADGQHISYGPDMATTITVEVQ